MRKLYTTLGALQADEFGMILPHEHVFVDLRTPDQPGYAEAAVDEVLAAGTKTLVFGCLVGATASFLGLRAAGGAEGVGTAATRSVVCSVLLVLLADVLLVGLIRVSIG